MAQKPVGTMIVELTLDDTKYTAGQRRILAGAQQSSKDINVVMKTVGTQSDIMYDAMRKNIENALSAIKKSHLSSADEIRRAQEGAAAKIKSINEQQFGYQTSMLGKLKENWLATSAAIVAAWYTVSKAVSAVSDVVLASARYETLGVVMQTVGNNAGYTGNQMEVFSQGLQKAGISMTESRGSLTRMVQAHLDLNQASKLARIAQDAAVIGNINSSEAFQRLVYGIQSAQVEMLRTIGINVSFENSYQTVAKATGRTADSFTEVEKSAIRMNAVIESGPQIFGAYEAAMDTAGKQLLSLERHYENLKVLAGAAFTPALAEIIQTITGAVTDLNGNLSGESKKAIEEWGINFRITLIGIEAEFMRVSMFLDKVGGTMTSAQMLLYGPGNALGIESSTKRFKAAADANMEYEKRYYDTEKALQALADKQVKLEESLTPYGKSSAKAAQQAAEDKRIRAGLAGKTADIDNPYGFPQWGATTGEAKKASDKAQDIARHDAEALMKMYEEIYGKQTQTYIRLTAEMNKQILTMEDDKLKELYEKNLVNTFKTSDKELATFKTASEVIAGMRERILSKEGIQAWATQLGTLFSTDWPSWMGISADRYKELDRMMGDLDQARTDKKFKLEEEIQAKIKDVTLTAQEEIGTASTALWERVEAQKKSISITAAAETVAAVKGTWSTIGGITQWAGGISGTGADNTGYMDTMQSEYGPGMGRYTGLPIGVINTAGQGVINAINNTWSNYQAEQARQQAEQQRQQEESLRAQQQYQAEQQRLWDAQIAAQKKFVESLHEQSTSITDWLSELSRGDLSPVQSASTWTMEYTRQKGIGTAAGATGQEVSEYLSYAKEYLEFQKSYGTGGSYQAAYGQVQKDVGALGKTKNLEELLAGAGLGQFEKDLRKIIDAFTDMGSSTEDLAWFMSAYNSVLSGSNGTIVKMQDVGEYMSLAALAAGRTKEALETYISATQTAAGDTATGAMIGALDDYRLKTIDTVGDNTTGTKGMIAAFDAYIAKAEEAGSNEDTKGTGKLIKALKDYIIRTDLAAGDTVTGALIKAIGGYVTAATGKDGAVQATTGANGLNKAIDAYVIATGKFVGDDTAGTGALKKAITDYVTDTAKFVGNSTTGTGALLSSMGEYTTAAMGTTTKTGELIGGLTNTKTPFENVIGAFEKLVGTTGLGAVETYLVALATKLGTTFTSTNGSAAAAGLIAGAQLNYIAPEPYISGYSEKVLSGTIIHPPDPHAFPGSKWYTGWTEYEYSGGQPIWSGGKAKGGLTSGRSVAGEIGPEWVAPTYEPERSNFLRDTGVAQTLKEILVQGGGGEDNSPIHVHLYLDGKEIQTVVARGMKRNPDLINATRRAMN